VSWHFATLTKTVRYAFGVSYVPRQKKQKKAQSPTFLAWVESQTNLAFSCILYLLAGALCLIMSYLYIYSKHSKIGVPNYIPNTAKQGKAFQTQENTGSKHNSTVHFSAF